jgi:hypothetical protein
MSFLSPTDNVLDRRKISFASGVWKGFFHAHRLKPACVFRVDTHLVNHANAEVIGYGPFYFNTRAHLHAYLGS